MSGVERKLLSCHCVFILTSCFLHNYSYPNPDDRLSDISEWIEQGMQWNRIRAWNCACYPGQLRDYTTYSWVLLADRSCWCLSSEKDFSCLKINACLSKRSIVEHINYSDTNIGRTEKAYRPLSISGSASGRLRY